MAGTSSQLTTTSTKTQPQKTPHPPSSPRPSAHDTKIATIASKKPSEIAKYIFSHPWDLDGVMNELDPTTTSAVLDEIDKSHKLGTSKLGNKAFGSRSLETFQGKGGTKDAAQEEQALLDVDDAGRAARIFVALRQGKSTNAFNQLAQWLMGANSSLPGEYSGRFRSELRDDIKKVFGEGDITTHSGHKKTQYLLDLLDHGKPSAYSKLLVALGEMTGSSIDYEEIIHIVETMSPADAAKIKGTGVFTSLQGLERMRVGKDRRNRTLSAFDAKLAENDLEKADPSDAGGVATATEKRNSAAIEHLCAIVEQHKKAAQNNVDLKELAAELMSWAAEHPPEVRRAATAPTSKFVTKLQAMTTGYKIRLNKFDKDYLIDLVAEHKPLPHDLFFTADKTQADLDAEHDDDKARESADRVAQVAAHTTRKAGKEYAGKRQKANYSHLREEISELTQHEREGLLYMKLPPDLRAKIAGQDISPDERDEIRKEALKIFEAELKTMGMDGDQRRKTLERFETGHAADFKTKGSGFDQLKELLNSTTYTREKTIVEAVARCKGSDYLHIRQDAKVMEKLEKQAGGRWPEVMAILGIDKLPPEHEKISLEQTKIRGVEQAAHDAADNAELRPEHWAALLGLAIDQNSTVDVQLLVTKTYFAAQRRAALPKTKPQGVVGQGDNALRHLDAYTFIDLVRGRLSAKHVQKLEGEPKHAEALLALKEHRYVDPSLALNATLYKGGGVGKRASGNDGNAEEMVDVASAFQGRKLLEEWSNISAFRALSKKSAKTPEAKAEKDRALRDFILDIHPERHEWLQNHLSNAALIKTVGELRAKIVEAGSTDPEFQKATKEEGLEFDAYARERTTALSLLDNQQSKDSGLQFNYFASQSNERKEARNELIGEFRSTQRDLDDNKITHQDDRREKVVEPHVAEIENKKEELELRTAAFDAMRQRAKTAIMLAIAVLLSVVSSVATMGMTSAVAPVLIKIILALGTGVVKQLVLRAIEGDDFNMRGAVLQVGMDTLMATAGSFGDWGAGAAIQEAGVGQIGSILTTEGVGKMFAQEGIKAAINLGAREAISTAWQMGTSESKVPVSGQLLSRALGVLGNFATASLGRFMGDSLSQEAGSYRNLENYESGSSAIEPGKAPKVDMHGNKAGAVENRLLQHGEWGTGESAKGITLLGKAFNKGASKGVGAMKKGVEGEMTPDDVSNQELGATSGSTAAEDRLGGWTKYFRQVTPVLMDRAAKQQATLLGKEESAGTKTKADILAARTSLEEAMLELLTPVAQMQFHPTMELVEDAKTARAQVEAQLEKGQELLQDLANHEHRHRRHHRHKHHKHDKSAEKHDDTQQQAVEQQETQSESQ